MQPYVFSTESKLIRFLAWFSLNDPKEVILDVLYKTPRIKEGEEGVYTRDICTVVRFLSSYFLKWVLNWCCIVGLGIVLVLFSIAMMAGILFAPWAIVSGIQTVYDAVGPFWADVLRRAWFVQVMFTFLGLAYLIVCLPGLIRGWRKQAREEGIRVMPVPDYKRWALYQNTHGLYVDISTCLKSVKGKYCIPVHIDPKSLD